MPAIGWMIAQGYKSIAEMDTLTATADIGNFAIQSDQDVGRDWMRPDNESDIFEQEAALIDAVDGSRAGYGGHEWTWKLRILSPKMVAYIENAVFSGGRSSPVTIRQPLDRATGASVTKNAMAQYHRRADHDPQGGGFDLYVISFIDGEDAPDGPDVTPNVSHSGNFTIGASNYWTITVSNVGDAATFADVVVVITIPTNCDFESVSGTGWTAEYSDNNQSSWSASPPAPLSDTTDVRLTYTDTIDVDEDAPDIILTVQPQTGTSADLTADVTTSGDTNNANDSDTDATTVAGSPFSSAFSSAFGKGN